MKTKNIKVLYSTRENSRGYAYPKIQMEGRWLEELGFQIGTHLVIEYEEGSIRIRPFTAEENAYEEKRKALADLEKKRKEYERLQRLHAAEIEQQLSMVAEEQSDYGTAGNSNPRYR